MATTKMSDNDVIDEGTDLSLIEAKELAALEQEMAEEAAALSGSLTVASSNISNAGKQFTLPDGTNLGNQMKVVILGYVKFHELYPNTVYNANNPEPPICFGSHKITDEAKPSPLVKKPECDVCDVCPNNEWGSKGQGKACKETYRVAVILPEIDKSIPYILKVVSTGLKHFDTSINAIQRTFGKNGNLAMPYAATVSAEFTDAQYPVVKITGTGAEANSPKDLLAYHHMAKDVTEALLK